MLLADRVVKCSVRKELKLTGGEMLKREAVRNRVIRFDEAQQAKFIVFGAERSTTRGKLLRVVPQQWQ